VKPPLVPAKPVPIVPADGLKRLFAACAGASFEARRDTALVMLLLDTGARREEMAGLTLADVDLDLDVLLVLGKGLRERTLPLPSSRSRAVWTLSRPMPRRTMAKATVGWMPTITVSAPRSRAA
jgi:site-specific recombinase XerD